MFGKIGRARGGQPSTLNSVRSLGVILVAISALMFGFTGVLTKSIRADPMTILCWRGFVGSILMGAYVLWRRHPNSSLRLG